MLNIAYATPATLRLRLRLYTATRSGRKSAMRRRDDITDFGQRGVQYIAYMEKTGRYLLLNSVTERLSNDVMMMMVKQKMLT